MSASLAIEISDEGETSPGEPFGWKRKTGIIIRNSIAYEEAERLSDKLDELDNAWYMDDQECERFEIEMTHGQFMRLLGHARLTDYVPTPPHWEGHREVVITLIIY